MTNEQKLTKLLQIAVENGWNLGGLFDGDDFELDIEDTDLIIIWGNYTKRIALNDLVLNWEEDQIPFLNALYLAFFKTTIYDFNYKSEALLKVKEGFLLNYVKLPTSQRLDYLFETFKHLL